MDNSKLTTIIEQALNDPQFRKQLIRDPQLTLGQYQLSQEELDVLASALQNTEDNSEAETVETRSSPWAINSLNLGGHR